MLLIEEGELPDDADLAIDKVVRMKAYGIFRHCKRAWSSYTSAQRVKAKAISVCAEKASWRKYIDIHRQRYIRAYIHTYIYIYIFENIYIHLHIHTHTDRHTDIHTYLQTYTRTYIHT